MSHNKSSSQQNKFLYQISWEWDNRWICFDGGEGVAEKGTGTQPKRIDTFGVCVGGSGESGEGDIKGMMEVVRSQREAWPPPHPRAVRLLAILYNMMIMGLAQKD